MSATIEYEIAKPKQHLSVNSPSHFQEVFAKAFSTLPYQLSEEDLPALRLVYRLNESEHCWMDLIELVEKYGRVNVSVAY